MRLDRYVMREMFVPFLAGSLILTLLFQANSYIFIAKQFNLDNVPMVAQFQWIMYQTPSYLKMVMPAGISLAAALAMTRLTRESEITALRAAGTRITRIVFPVFLFGALVSAGNYYVVEKLMPIAARKANELFLKNERLGETALMRSNALITIDKYAASLGLVTKEGSRLVIHDLILIDRSGPNQTTIIRAHEGSYENGLWTLTSPYFYVFQGGEETSLEPKKIAQIKQSIDMDQLLNVGSDPASYDAETIEALNKSIIDAKKAHVDARDAKVELSSRYAIPASCALFALTSSVFAIRFGKSGGFAGVLVSFFMVMLYYNAFIISTDILGKMESVPPWFAAWLPNIIFGALGLIGARRLE
jgi:lipopolysaccharide export system permease protein